jgi:hypothetical protein
MFRNFGVYIQVHTVSRRGTTAWHLREPQILYILKCSHMKLQKNLTIIRLFIQCLEIHFNTVLNVLTGSTFHPCSYILSGGLSMNKLEELNFMNNVDFLLQIYRERNDH